MSQTKETCQEYLSPRDRYDSWHPRRCGRPLFEDSDLCKLHTAARDRRLSKAAMERVVREADAEREAQGRDRARRLREAVWDTGTAVPEYRASFTGSGGRHTGGVSISAELADTLLERIDSMQARLDALDALTARRTI